VIAALTRRPQADLPSVPAHENAIAPNRLRSFRYPPLLRNARCPRRQPRCDIGAKLVIMVEGEQSIVVEFRRGWHAKLLAGRNSAYGKAEAL